MFGDLISRFRLNMDLHEKERGTYPTADERKALKQAKKAERAFRIAKGYQKKRFWER